MAKLDDLARGHAASPPPAATGTVTFLPEPERAEPRSTP